MFKSELKLRKGEGNLWIVLSPLYYFQEEEARLFIVPTGFYTDLASIPAPARMVLPVNDIHARSSVLHDYLYAFHRRLRLTRKQADDIFLQAMKSDKVPYWKRYTMYLGVRLGGGFRFKMYEAI